MEYLLSCHFEKAWIGKCKNSSNLMKADDGEYYCDEHLHLRCSCGTKATHECEETLGLVCGYPLCDNCEHKSAPGMSLAHGLKYSEVMKKVQMKPSIIDVFACEVNHKDEWGRGGEITAAFTSESLAKEYVKGKGWWGGHGMVLNRKAIVVGKLFFLLDDELASGIPLDEKSQITHFEDMSNFAIKQQALAKLTEEERAALGL